MSPEEELELVKKAIHVGKTITGCFEWHEHASERVQLDPDLHETTPAEIRKIVLAYFIAGGKIDQVKEKRPEYNDFDFYYKMIVRCPEFPTGLFVEMRLFDPDEDFPTVLLVNAHPQSK